MAGDVRIGLAARVGGGIEFQPQVAEVFADEFPDLRGILAHPSREDQSINCGKATEFVGVDGGCPGASAALATDSAGAAKILLRTAILVYLFIS